MSSINCDKDTPKNLNYKNIENDNNIYKPMKIIPSRGRADSNNTIDNGQLNLYKYENSNNLKFTPSASSISVKSSQHSRSSSLNSTNSHSSESKKYLSEKNIVEKKDNKFHSSPLFHSSSALLHNNNTNKTIRTVASSEETSLCNYNKNYGPLGLQNIPLNNYLHPSQYENDVTSQYSDNNPNLNVEKVSINSSLDDNSKSIQSGSSSSATTSSSSNIIINSKNNNETKIKLNDNTLKNKKNHSANELNKSINSKGKSKMNGVASSDIGNFYSTKNPVVNNRPKSTLSYQFDMNARSLTNGINSANTPLNSHTPNLNVYNPSNYLSANTQYKDRKKYNSCYSISSNSTILAPPRKYLNNNSSVYSYPKVKQMIYIILITLIIYCLCAFACFSSKWIVVDTRLKSQNPSKTDNILIHYEFGISKFCYSEGNKTVENELICLNIKDLCPKFCTEDSCVSFNADGDRKQFEEELSNQSSLDPNYHFCRLTSKSRLIGKIYVFLNFVNVISGLCVLFIIIKYREYKKGSLKESLRRRISVLSEHYSLTNDKRKNKLKNNNNIINGLQNTDQNNGNFKVNENISYHPQYSEPESYEDSINNDFNNNNNNNSNNSSNKNNKNSNTNNNNKVKYTQGTRVTYNIPTSSIHNNPNMNESQSIQLNQQNITSLYMNTSRNEELNNTTEEDILKKRKIIKYIFIELIVMSLVIGIIGLYYIKKWVKEEKHIGMIYLKNSKIKESDIDLDKSLGVSIILIAIATILNIIIAIYLIVILCVVHFSQSTTYWNNEGDDDMYSQSYDSSIQNNYNNYNPSNYNPNIYNNGNNYNGNNMEIYIP